MNPIALLPPPLRAVAEIVLTLVVAAVIAFIAQAYIVKPYRVPTGSMIPTLQPGDRVIADRLTLDFRDPARTLKSEEVDPQVQSALATLTQKFNATLRA